MPAAPDVLQSRPALPGDEACVIGLMRAFYAEEHLVFDELATRNALRELLAHPQLGTVLLLESASVPIGYLALTFGFSLEFQGRYALLDELYLIPSVRGRGWGRAAVEFAAEAARAHGVAAVRLEVNRANSKARALYLKAGFRDDHRELFTRWLS